MRVDIALFLELAGAGRTGRIGDTCDYDRVTDAVVALLRFRRYRLIEMAAEEVAAMLCALEDRVARVQLSVEKPNALLGRAGSAAVEVDRARAAYPLEWDHQVGVREAVVVLTRDACISLVQLPAGAALPAGSEPALRELVLVRSGTLQLDRNPLQAGETASTQDGELRGLHALSDSVLIRCRRRVTSAE